MRPPESGPAQTSEHAARLRWTTGGSGGGGEGQTHPEYRLHLPIVQRTPRSRHRSVVRRRARRGPVSPPPPHRPTHPEVRRHRSVVRPTFPTRSSSSSGPTAGFTVVRGPPAQLQAAAGETKMPAPLRGAPCRRPHLRPGSSVHAPPCPPQLHPPSRSARAARAPRPPSGCRPRCRRRPARAVCRSAGPGRRPG